VRRKHLLPAMAMSLLLFAAGCGSSTVVSGTVTYNGEPINNGSIQFSPEDGKGPIAGGTITGGKYRVEEKLTPGKKIVKIEGFKDIDVPTSSEEMQRRAEEGAMVELAAQIPENAKGNNITVEVKAGEQTHNFALESPADG